MANDKLPVVSLRFDRDELTRLGMAFIVSLLLHACCFGGYKLGAKLHVWQTVKLSVFTEPIRHTLAKLLGSELHKIESPVLRDVPLVFVDVNPAVASAEPPKTAKYYSDRHSIAANPDADNDTGVPKIDGTQTLIPKTENVPRPQPMPLQPLPPSLPEPGPTLQEKTEPAQPPGDLVMAKPQAGTDKTPIQNAQTRPRTLREALAKIDKPTGIAGQKMKQEGGVKRRALESSLDVTALPFGAYDRMIVEAVQNRWYYLLDSGDFARDRTGKVVLEFNLTYDGRVTDMKVVENTVNDLLCLLCQKAILDPAPYPRWPAEMRRTLGSDTRRVRFTFYYD